MEKHNEICFLSIALALSTISLADQLFSKIANNQQNATFYEQKYLTDRCRLIQQQAYGYGVGALGGFGSGQVHRAIIGIEDFLLSFRSALGLPLEKKSKT